MSLKTDIYIIVIGYGVEYLFPFFTILESIKAKLYIYSALLPNTNMTTKTKHFMLT